ncbi:hypothetical protein AB0M02_17075 [Actinoplanes sp. NPDC051861]|uniref:hypothetical protein n=1 Tax=Actinoplanes sp. NPDC051861 TaxID=3155170 RepID=UPI00342E21CE
MNERARTAWVPMYCSGDRQARVATFRQAGQEWQIVEVGGPEPIGESGGGGLPVTGGFGYAPGYRGCPACGREAYVRCGPCGQLGCWRTTEELFTCGNCGISGPVSGAIDSLGALDVG